MKTQITIGDRLSGKTTKLIKRSAFEGLYILTVNRLRAEAIFHQAKLMGLNIPFPITVDECLKYHVGRSIISGSVEKNGILIDDVDAVLEYIFRGLAIHEVTLTDYGNISNISTIIAERENVEKPEFVLDENDRDPLGLCKLKLDAKTVLKTLPSGVGISIAHEIRGDR